MRVDPEVLRTELAAWTWPHDEPGVRDLWMRAAVRRIAATLALLPEGTADGRLLELGSPPFFTSLCLRRLWPGRVTHTGYAHDGARRLTERLVAVDGSAEGLFELDCFNVETDEFPYADGSFDVVLFSELIEHLAVNPMWTLAEIHRVLRPGGQVVITTPNALSLERLRLWLTGGSDPVDRYMPLFGYGARHNREWNPRELRSLLEETGFAIEALAVRDLDPQTLAGRLLRGALRLALRPLSRQPHHAHIFARARRGDVFRWRFPSLLYDHMTLYRLVRHPFVEMDVNDAIQCGGGWSPLEQVDGVPARRLQGEAVAWLRAIPTGRRLTIRARALDVPAQLSAAIANHRGAFGGGRIALQPGAWTDVSFDLSAALAAGDELDLRLASTSPTAINRAALA